MQRQPLSRTDGSEGGSSAASTPRGARQRMTELKDSARTPKSSDSVRRDITRDSARSRGTSKDSLTPTSLAACTLCVVFVMVNCFLLALKQHDLEEEYDDDGTSSRASVRSSGSNGPRILPPGLLIGDAQMEISVKWIRFFTTKQTLPLPLDAAGESPARATSSSSTPYCITIREATNVPILPDMVNFLSV